MSKNDKLMSDLKVMLLARELTADECEAHGEAGEDFHLPSIAPTDYLSTLLNTCGICGAYISPTLEGWIPISQADADHLRTFEKGQR